MSTDDLKRLKPKYPNQELSVVIPLGVSVNHLYMFKRGRRFMTKKGQDYMQKVMMIVDNAVKSQNYKLEEACDVLHFVMSIAIDNNVELVEEKQPENYNPDDYDMNDLIGMLDCMISDMFIEKDWEDLNPLLMVLGIVVNKCGYDVEDLYKCYKSKNKENHKRPDNKY